MLSAVEQVLGTISMRIHVYVYWITSIEHYRTELTNYCIEIPTHLQNFANEIRFGCHWCFKCRNPSFQTKNPRTVAPLELVVVFYGRPAQLMRHALEPQTLERGTAYTQLTSGCTPNHNRLDQSNAGRMTSPHTTTRQTSQNSDLVGSHPNIYHSLQNQLQKHATFAWNWERRYSVVADRLTTATSRREKEKQTVTWLVVLKEGEAPAGNLTQSLNARLRSKLKTFTALNVQYITSASHHVHSPHASTLAEWVHNVVSRKEQTLAKIGFVFETGKRLQSSTTHNAQSRVTTMKPRKKIARKFIYAHKLASTCN